MISEILFLILGFILLIGGGESFVKGASRLAYTFNISPLAIGLTVVAIGTSAPELSVAIRASLSGHMDVSFGDIVGSNIFNVFGILGITSLIRPVQIPFLRFRNDLLWMQGFVILFVFAALDLLIHRQESLMLLACVLLYLYFCLTRKSKQEETQEEFNGTPAEYRTASRLLISLILLGIGAACLIFGARFLLNGAVGLARHFGLSEVFIGLAIVAVGTSLPELATSVIAALRRKGDIAVGNIIGSNIFNIGLIVGTAASISKNPVAVPGQILRFDLIYMFFAFILWILIIWKYQILDKKFGLLFIGVYILYIFLQVSLFQH